MPSSKAINYASVFMFALSVTLSLLSLNTPVIINIGQLGFFSDLTPMYVAGLGLGLVTLVMTAFGGVNRIIFVMQFVAFEIYIWVIPQLLMPGLRFPASAHDLFFYSTTASISATGFLHPLTYIYQSWPLPYILAAMTKLVLGPIGYLQIYFLTPLFLNLFVTLMLYCFFKAYLPGQSQLALMGIIIFELFNFTEQFTTVSPFSMGSLLFYAFASAMLTSWAKGRELARNQVLIFMIFAVAISASHPVIAVEMILATFSIYLIIGIRHTHVRSLAFLYLLSGSTAIIIWAIFGGEPLFSTYSALLSTVLRFVGGVVVPAATQLTVGSPAHLLVNEVRLAVLIAMVALALPSLIRLSRRDLKVKVLLSFFVGIAVSGVLLGEIQGNSFYILLLSAALPALLALDLMSLAMVPRRLVGPIMLFFLVSSVPVSILVVYGNLASESVPSSSIAAGDFYSEFVAPPAMVGSISLAQSGFVGFYGVNLGSISPFTNNGIPLEMFQKSQTHFLVLGLVAQSLEQAEGTNISVARNLELWASHSTEYGLVYSSEYNNIYDLLGN